MKLKTPSAISLVNQYPTYTVIRFNGDLYQIKPQNPNAIHSIIIITNYNRSIDSDIIKQFIYYLYDNFNLSVYQRLNNTLATFTTVNYYTWINKIMS